MNEQLADEIRTLALRYGLPSRFTSYLVQEPEMVVAQTGGGAVHRLLTRVSGKVASSPAPTSGADAVQAASSARRMRSVASSQELSAAEEEMLAEALGRTPSALPRDVVAGRVFEQRDDVWTDVTHDSTVEVIQVKAFGSAWFDLLDALPELEDVLQAHDSVVIAGAGLSVQVGAEGAETFDEREFARIVDGFRGAPSGS